MREGGAPPGTPRCAGPRPSGNGARCRGALGASPQAGSPRRPCVARAHPVPTTLGRLWPDNGNSQLGSSSPFHSPGLPQLPHPEWHRLSFHRAVPSPLPAPVTPRRVIRGLWQRPDPGPPGAPCRPSAAHDVALPRPVFGRMIRSSGTSVARRCRNWRRLDSGRLRCLRQREACDPASLSALPEPLTKSPPLPANCDVASVRAFSLGDRKVNQAPGGGSVLNAAGHASCGL